MVWLGNTKLNQPPLLLQHSGFGTSWRRLRIVIVRRHVRKQPDEQGHDYVRDKRVPCQVLEQRVFDLQALDPAKQKRGHALMPHATCIIRNEGTMRHTSKTTTNKLIDTLQKVVLSKVLACRSA